MLQPVLDHPCFNAAASLTTGRLHLPVAPMCNIQCAYCDRRYSCVNESRPGVTATMLKPASVVSHVAEHLRHEPRTRIIGIAGPGDPLATAERTISILRQVKENFPHLSLCLSTNGLNLVDYLPALHEVGLNFLTITVNASTPEVGRYIYSWVSCRGVIYRGEEAAALLIARQRTALAQLRQFPITVKINTVVIPGLNDDHVEVIAREMAGYGVDVMNCIPLLPVAGTPLAACGEPSALRLESIRKQAELWLPQIHHCRRCRADAAGLLSDSDCVPADNH